jgi:glycine cleavage system aminomethyltransferase T
MFARPVDVRISFHANERLHERSISRDEVMHCVTKGIIRPDGHRMDDHYVYSLDRVEVVLAHRNNKLFDLVTAIRRK